MQRHGKGTHSLSEQGIPSLGPVAGMHQEVYFTVRGQWVAENTRDVPNLGLQAKGRCRQSHAPHRLQRRPPFASPPPGVTVRPSSLAFHGAQVSLSFLSQVFGFRAHSQITNECYLSDPISKQGLHSAK